MPRTRKFKIRELYKLLENVDVWKQLIRDYSGRINDEENKKTRMPQNIVDAYQTMIDATLSLIPKLKEEIDEQNQKTAINVDEIKPQKEEANKEANEETNEENEPATTVEMGGGKRQKKRKSKKQMKKRKSGKKTRRSKK